MVIKNTRVGRHLRNPSLAASAVAHTASNAPETIRTIQGNKKLTFQWSVLSLCGYCALVRRLGDEPKSRLANHCRMASQPRYRTSSAPTA